MKKYVMALIVCFGVLMTVSSCEGISEDITIENNEKIKDKKPE